MTDKSLLSDDRKWNTIRSGDSIRVKLKGIDKWLMDLGPNNIVPDYVWLDFDGKWWDDGSNYEAVVKKYNLLASDRWKGKLRFTKPTGCS